MIIFLWVFLHGWFLNVYPTLMTTDLTTNSVTWRHRNETRCRYHGAAVFSVSRAANFTRCVMAIKHAALLRLRSKCLMMLVVMVMLLTPNYHWILSAALGFRSSFAPPSGNLHWFRFESSMVHYGKQLASRGWGVSVIITWSLSTAVIGLCYKTTGSVPDQRINGRAYVCLFFSLHYFWIIPTHHRQTDWRTVSWLVRVRLLRPF